MRFNRLAPIAALALTVVTTVSAQIPSGARRLGAPAVAAPKLMVISFRPNPPVDAAKIIELVQKNRHIKLAGNDKLRIERDTPESRDRAQLVRDVLRSLGQPKSAPA